MPLEMLDDELTDLDFGIAVPLLRVSGARRPNSLTSGQRLAEGASLWSFRPASSPQLVAGVARLRHAGTTPVSVLRRADLLGRYRAPYTPAAYREAAFRSQVQLAGAAFREIDRCIGAHRSLLSSEAPGETSSEGSTRPARYGARRAGSSCSRSHAPGCCTSRGHFFMWRRAYTPQAAKRKASGWP